MKYIDAEEITPIMAEYVADVFSRKNHLDNISYGYCMEIAEVFRRYAERAKQPEQLPGIEEHGIPGKDFIPVEWVDACEKYGKWKIVQQEQPEVDLEEEIKNYLATECAEDDEPSVSEIARHFYELGLKSK